MRKARSLVASFLGAACVLGFLAPAFAAGPIDIAPIQPIEIPPVVSPPIQPIEIPPVTGPIEVFPTPEGPHPLPPFPGPNPLPPGPNGPGPIPNGPGPIANGPDRPTIPGGGGGPTPRAQVYPSAPMCVIDDAYDHYQDYNCNSYAIGVDDLNRELNADMGDAVVLADLLRRIDDHEVYVDLPPPPAAAQAVAELKANLAAAVAAVGGALRDAKNRGDSRSDALPSIDEIDDLVSQATSDVDAIDQPLNEDPEARRIRLGIGRHTRTLADTYTNAQ